MAGLNFQRPCFAIMLYTLWIWYPHTFVGFCRESWEKNPNQNQKDPKNGELNHELREKMITLSYKYVIHNTNTQTDVCNPHHRTLQVATLFWEQPILISL